VHDEAPEAEYLPIGQLEVQLVVFPVTEEYVPALHAVQLEEPVVA